MSDSALYLFLLAGIGQVEARFPSDDEVLTLPRRCANGLVVGVFRWEVSRRFE